MVVSCRPRIRAAAVRECFRASCTFSGHGGGTFSFDSIEWESKINEKKEQWIRAKCVKFQFDYMVNWREAERTEAGECECADRERASARANASVRGEEEEEKELKPKAIHLEQRNW